MHDAAVVVAGREHDEAVLRDESIAVEILLHGEAGAEQADGGVSCKLYRIGGWIGDMQQRNVHCGQDELGDFVHGVGADDDALRTCCLQSTRGVCHQRASGRPVARLLHPLNFVKVHAVEHQFRRMQAAKLLFHGFVDDAVVRGGGFPAHTANEADDFHAVP